MTEHAPAPGSADPLELSGVVPPTITAFDEDGDLDRSATAAHAELVVEGGASGVFPLGTNGEFALLEPGERDEVVRAVVEAVGDEVPVIAGVGAQSTRETVARARAAEQAGADGLVVVTPYYYPVDDEAAVAHYRTVVEAVDRPVYVYHIPGRTGNELSLSAIERIASLEGVAGCKDSSKDVPWLGQAIDRAPDLTFLVGSDSLLCSGLAAGCSGAVSAVANVFPELVVDCYEAYDRGDRERAREIQSTVYEVRSALKDGPYMAGVKTALSIRDPGFDPGPLRSPLRRMDESGRRRLRERLTNAGVL
jgi:4-hydroxy-tetrahydrodipicolinate synthase/2-dehydro-3-deoxy-phosphogluconate/2-dehydro-3-deoxy-6-phosphogalactonate aldolase